MDMVVWLRSLGLGKYEAAFRDNEIDETIRGFSGASHRRRGMPTMIPEREGSCPAGVRLPP